MSQYTLSKRVAATESLKLTTVDCMITLLRASTVHEDRYRAMHENFLRLAAQQ